MSARHDTSTVIHIRVPRPILAAIKKIADKESRTVTGLVLYWMKQQVAK